MGLTPQRFESGSIKDHKRASTHWVKDVGPTVETYIGFIETYVDPYGARAEWEGTIPHTEHLKLLTDGISLGFTAIVNKELSVKYNELVDKAPELIKVLPWGKNYEVDVFKRPDFTALEIVSFATGGEWLVRMIYLSALRKLGIGIPAGINVSVIYVPCASP